MSAASGATPDRPALKLQLKLPCADLEQVLRRYGKELARGLLFVRAPAPRAVGTLVRLDARLADGSPCLRAAATISRVVESPPSDAGMELKLLAADDAGRAILRGLHGPNLRRLKLTAFASAAVGRAPIAQATSAPIAIAAPPPPSTARRTAPILGLDLGGQNLRAAALHAAEARPRQIATTRRGARDETISRPLNELKELAAVRLQAVVSRAVIAVPASFRAGQREVVRMTTGLQVERIVSAPIAASLLFAHGKNLASRRVLVYDLGASRFDATLVEIRGNTYEAIAIRSGEDASGDAIDAALAEWLAEQFHEQHGVALASDPVIADRLLRAAERAKIALTDQLSAPILEAGLIARDGRPRNLEAQLSRTELVLRAGAIIDQTIDVCRELMLSKKFASSDLHEVLLIGAQSRMPLVRARLRNFFGVEPVTALDPDQAAVQGAALLAAHLESGSPDAPILIDAAPFPVLQKDTPPPEPAAAQVSATPMDLFRMVSAPPPAEAAQPTPEPAPANEPAPAPAGKKGWLGGIFGKKKKP